MMMRRREEAEEVFHCVRDRNAVTEGVAIVDIEADRVAQKKNLALHTQSLALGQKT